MATVRRELTTAAAPAAVWDAVRDVGALHTRLVPGFVARTQLEAGVRVVTFGDGGVVREPIVTVDDEARRLVWSLEGGALRHYNAALQVVAEGSGSRVVWTADLLPHEAAGAIAQRMEAGLAAMKRALDRL